EGAECGAEPIALALVTDPARDADVAGLGHVDEVAARQGDEGGDARALRAERLLGHLHENLLALPQHVLDRGRRRPRPEILDVDVGSPSSAAPGELGAAYVARLVGEATAVEDR